MLQLKAEDNRAISRNVVVLQISLLCDEIHFERIKLNENKKSRERKTLAKNVQYLWIRILQISAT